MDVSEVLVCEADWEGHAPCLVVGEPVPERPRPPYLRALDEAEEYYQAMRRALEEEVRASLRRGSWWRHVLRWGRG